MTEFEEFKELLGKYSLRGLSNYLGVTKDTVSRWSNKGAIPRRWKRLTIEYLENCNADVIEFTNKLGEELRS